MVQLWLRSISTLENDGISIWHLSPLQWDCTTLAMSWQNYGNESWLWHAHHELQDHVQPSCPSNSAIWPSHFWWSRGKKGGVAAMVALPHQMKTFEDLWCKFRKTFPESQYNHFRLWNVGDTVIPSIPCAELPQLFPRPPRGPGGLRIFALELEGPFLYITHEMFHSFLHWPRKLPYLTGSDRGGSHGTVMERKGHHEGYQTILHWRILRKWHPYVGSFWGIPHCKKASSVVWKGWNPEHVDLHGGTRFVEGDSSVLTVYDSHPAKFFHT